MSTLYFRPSYKHSILDNLVPTINQNQLNEIFQIEFPKKTIVEWKILVKIAESKFYRLFFALWTPFVMIGVCLLKLKILMTPPAVICICLGCFFNLCCALTRVDRKVGKALFSHYDYRYLLITMWCYIGFSSWSQVNMYPTVWLFTQMFAIFPMSMVIVHLDAIPAYPLTIKVVMIGMCLMWFCRLLIVDLWFTKEYEDISFCIWTCFTSRRFANLSIGQLIIYLSKHLFFTGLDWYRIRKKRKEWKIQGVSEEDINQMDAERLWRKMMMLRIGLSCTYNPLSHSTQWALVTKQCPLYKVCDFQSKEKSGNTLPSLPAFQKQITHIQQEEKEEQKHQHPYPKNNSISLSNNTDSKIIVVNPCSRTNTNVPSPLNLDKIEELKFDQENKKKEEEMRPSFSKILFNRTSWFSIECFNEEFNIHWTSSFQSILEKIIPLRMFQVFKRIFESPKFTYVWHINYVLSFIILFLRWVFPESIFSWEAGIICFSYTLLSTLFTLIYYLWCLDYSTFKYILKQFEFLLVGYQIIIYFVSLLLLEKSTSIEEREGAKGGGLFYLKWSSEIIYLLFLVLIQFFDAAPRFKRSHKILILLSGILYFGIGIISTIFNLSSTLWNKNTSTLFCWWICVDTNMAIWFALIQLTLSQCKYLYRLFLSEHHCIYLHVPFISHCSTPLLRTTKK